jgi:hypothetical protein
MKLCDHLLQLSDMLQGVTFNELLRVSCEFPKRNNVNYNSNNEIKSRGIDWAHAFLSKRENQMVRKSESTTVSRILAFNKIEVIRFYENLMVVFFNVQVWICNSIFSVDKSGFSYVQKLSSVTQL